MSIGESTKGAVRCILYRVLTHIALKYILRELERSPRQNFPVHPAYTDREDSDCGEQGYSGRLLLTRLDAWAETSPPTVNVGSAEYFKTVHGKSDVRLFTISVKSGKGGGRTLIFTV